MDDQGRFDVVTLGVRPVAAIIYTVLTVIVAAFQIALAIGAPWGSYAMAGAFPGRFPPALRVLAIMQAVILLLLAAIVLARAGVAFLKWTRLSTTLIWVVVVVVGVSVVLNVLTPNSGERSIWAPVAMMLLLSSVLVATGPKPTPA